MFSRRAALAAAGCVLLAGGLGLYVWKRIQVVPAPAGPLRVAVIGFENQTGDAALDWLEPLLPFGLRNALATLPETSVLAARNANEASATGAARIFSAQLERSPAGPVLHYFVFSGDARALAEGRLAVAPSADPRLLLDPLARAAAQALDRRGTPAAADVHTRQAARLLAAGLAATDAAEASQSFAAAAAADPTCGWCWQGWAERLGQLKGPQATLEVLERSHNEAKGISPLSRARLDLLEAGLKGDLAGRGAALEKLCQALPSDAGLLSQSAEVSVALKRFQQAEATLRRAVSLEPARAELRNLHGYSLAYLGRYDEAQAELKEYARLDENSPNPADSQGEVALMSGRFAEAARFFEASYAKNAAFNAGEALEKAAQARWLAGDKVEAGQLVERYLRARQQSGDAFAELRRARWQYLFGQTAAARRLLLDLAAQPRSPVASVAGSLAALYALAAGDESAARAALKQAQAAAHAPGQEIFLRFAASALDPSLADKLLPTPALQDEARAAAATARGQWAQAAGAWQAALRHASGGADSPQRELLALALAGAGRAAEAAPLVGSSWPLMQRDQALFYDFLLYPNLFYTRAEMARAAHRGAEAQRFYDLFLQYAGDRADRYGQFARARASSRL